MTKQATNNKEAKLESLHDYSKKDLSDLLDNIINNISKLSNERDFFFDYFKNLETQMELKQDKDFAKGAVYKKSNRILNLGENIGNKFNKSSVLDSNNPRSTNN